MYIDIRLRKNGQDSTGFKYTREGRLEVYHSNTWTAVCSNSWNNNIAEVACRQLGMATVRSWSHILAPIDQVYSVWLTSVSCDGGENALSHCKNVVWDTRPCSNGKIVELSCNAGELFIFTQILLRCALTGKHTIPKSSDFVVFKVLRHWFSRL